LWRGVLLVLRIANVFVVAFDGEDGAGTRAHSRLGGGARARFLKFNDGTMGD